tara:strand:- start:744 stop:953 length:210 start_codon:yes stop_codon:yes gene_type:complete
MKILRDIECTLCGEPEMQIASKGEVSLIHCFACGGNLGGTAFNWLRDTYGLDKEGARIWIKGMEDAQGL